MIQYLSPLSHLQRLVLAVSLILGFPAFASEENPSRGNEGEGAGLSAATTQILVETLERGMRECQSLQEVYRFDCYRKSYRRTANQLAGRPTYAGAMAALIGVKKTLDQIVAENRDPASPKKRQGIEFHSPVKSATIPKATTDFAKALDLAETTLTGSPEWTQAHYSSIAKVVQSNKVLLRS